MTSKKELAAYETDASMIEGNASDVIFPESAEEISRIVKASSSVTIRGGGTSLVGGAVPQNCLVLDLSKMNKILEFDARKKTISVEPGIILDELNNYLEKYNLEFPVKPSSHAVCTLGGMIATNASGNRAVKYSKTSNWIESLEVVDGRGEILEIGKTDVSDFAGMEGITGIITKAKFKLEEKKKRTASLLALKSLDEVINIVNKLKSMKEVSALEFLDKLSSSLLGLEDSYHLIIEFESGRGEFKDSRYDELMKKRDSLYPVLAQAGYTHIEDPKILLIRFRELAEFLEYEKTPFFGHLGVGIIHPVFQKNEREKIKKMLNLVRKLHGSITGEHGIGMTKKEFLDASDRKLIERIKKRRDPLLKLNCGKVIDLKDEISKKIMEERKEELEKIEENLNELEKTVKDVQIDADNNPEENKELNAEENKNDNVN